MQYWYDCKLQQSPRVARRSLTSGDAEAVNAGDGVGEGDGGNDLGAMSASRVHGSGNGTRARARACVHALLYGRRGVQAFC